MPSISDIKKLYPEAKNLSDDQIMSVFNEYVMDNVKSVYPEAKGLSQDEVFGVIGNQHRIVKNAGVAGRVKDFGLDVAKGVIGAGESVVGLADLVTGNATGNFLRDSIGYDPKTSKQMLDSWQSDERQQESRAVQDTKGFVNTLGALVDNPAVAVGAVGESAPLMLGTAGAVRAAATQMLSKAGIVAGTEEAAKFLARPEVASRLALIGSATEGAMTAGNIQETARQEGRNWSDSAGYAAAGGLGTAAIGRLASKILPDADVLAGTAGLGAKAGAKEGMLASAKAIGKGIVQEGALEEMPQSAQEQVASNLALGKPWDEGVSEAAAMGLATGGLMGGGMTAANRFSPAVKTDPFQDFADADEGTNFNPDATARDAMLDQVQSIDPRLTRIAQAEQTKAAAQQAIATAPTIADAVDAFNVATAAGSSSMVDQSQLLNDVNEATNASEPIALDTQETQANDAQVGVEQAAAPTQNLGNVGNTGNAGNAGNPQADTPEVKQVFGEQPTTTGVLEQKPAALTIPKEIADRIAKKTDAELSVMAKTNPDPVVQEAVKHEQVIRESAKPTKPKQDRKAVYPESDSALVAIAKLGGMDTQQLLTNGFDQSDISVQKGARVSKKTGQLGKAPFRAKQVGFNMPIHRNGGMSFDGMREALVQYGYLPEDASVNDAIELLRSELRGEPVYTASAVQAQAEAAEADRQAMMEAEQEANEASGYDELQGTAEERYADALIEELYGEEVAALARGMRVAGLTEEEINAEIEAFNQRTGGKDGAGQSQERSSEGRAEESGTDAEVFGGEETGDPFGLGATESADPFGLEGQTNEEAAAEYKQQQAPEEISKEQIDREVDGFGLQQQSQPKPQGVQGDLVTADGRAAKDATVNAENVAKSEVTKPATKIADFGEKIGGAKKDIWTSHKDKLDDAAKLDIKAESLSKSWPEPNYQALIDAGADPFVVAFMRASRDAIPRKPSATWKLKSWASSVELLRDTSAKLLSGEIDANRAKELLQKAGDVSSNMRKIAGRIELYQLVGHRQSLDGVSLEFHHYTLYKGQENVSIWSIEKEAKATAFSNWPAEIVTGKTKTEVLEKFKEMYDKIDLNKKAERTVSFDLYSQGNKFYVGKKMGRNITQLAGPFDTVKEARAYRTDNQEELIARLEKAKEIPAVRRDTNNPRVGEDMRGGQDVTPELFAETFGFKGVEFGNWVEQKKRQKDLNDSFDALMDMAAIIGVPPKALSLNGELGLAFGARGSGGVDPAAAHYEPGKVVINLTKKEGAGSLGHEWWHALDNYFSRLRGKGGEFTTQALDVSLADRESQFIANTPVRKEMIEAFGAVMRAIRNTSLKARSSKLDAKRSKEYWTGKEEMSARAFESYLISKLQDQNASNDYLANIVDQETWKAAESLGFELDDSYPYPTAGEMPLIREAFDRFFDTIQTKETDKGVALFSQGQPSANTHTATTLTAALQSLPGVTGKAVRNLTGNLLNVITSDQIPDRVLRDAGVRYSATRVQSENGLPNQADENRVIDGAELKALRRAAASIERPRDGVFLRVTEDGKAIATGPKGARVPDRFIRFAEENGLAFEVRRDGRGRQRAGDYPMGASIPSKTDPMPVEYRESGAMYFGEGNVFYDRTGMTRFSRNTDGIRAYVDPKDGKVYVVADNIPKNWTQEELLGLIEHEVSVHVMKMGQNDADFQKLLNELEGMRETGSVKAKAARAAVPKGTNPDHIKEETLAYFVQQNPTHSLTKRVIAWLKTAIAKLAKQFGGEKQLWVRNWLNAKSESDLIKMAHDALLKAAWMESEPQFDGQLAYSVKELDGGSNGKGRGFWDILRARGEGFRGVYPGSTVQAISVRGRARKAVGVIGRYRGDDASTIIRWNDNLAGFDGYYSVGVKYKNAFATYFIPANRFTSPEDALLNDDFLRENAFFSIGFSFNPDGYELHVSDPVNGSSIFNEMLANGRLKPIENYSGDGSHHYHAVQFYDKRDLPMLMSEAVRRLAIHIGKAPERVYSNGRDTGVNKERPRDYNADQVQSKFSTGNRGTFDGSNPDIRYSKASPAQPAPLPEETRARAAQRKIQDKFNRFTVIKDWLKSQGIQLSEQADVYKAEERMHSRFANKVEDFRTKLVEPLIKKIQATGFSMDDVSLFLHAQHAEERNNQIAKINPKVADGSGMSTADANKVLAAAPAELKALANEFRQITEMTKQTLLDAGIISQDMVDAWEGAYSNYVPLKGGPDEKAKSGTGKGLHVNGKMKRALGHGKREGGEWIVENILADYERAVMLAEKNRVGHHLVRMALEAGRDDLITLNKPEKRAVLRNDHAYELRKNGAVIGVFNTQDAARMFKTMNGGTGITITKTNDPSVIYSASPMLQDNEANVYVNGHAIRVQINDELLAQAYKNLGAEPLNAIFSAGRMLNGYLSKAYTGYNPEFILTNIVRDFTTGLINITGEEGALFAAKAAKNYVSSFGSLLKYAVSGKENQWIKDYRDDGGNTGAAYLSDLERLGKEIKTEYDSYKGVIENLKARDGAGAARAAGRNLFNVSLKWIEHLNQAGENAMRLSIYRAAIESGKTRAEAASLAKNSTVNFNRKGELGANINALYLFFNAGVQGTSALAHAHFKGKHKYQAWALSSGMIGLGFLAAAAFGGGDEDDYDRELSDYDKSRNLVIRAGDSWVKIPVPYGYGFFYNLGRHLADAERKGEWSKMPWHLASDFVGEFTPFSGVVAGKEPDIRQGIYALPTAFQIPGAVAVNRTGMGSPIFPESKFDENQPDHLKMWRNTKGTLADDLAQVLDKAGLQVSPETLKYLGRTATGGSGAFVGSVFDAGKLTLEGADIETKEMPFVRKFVKEGSVSDYRSAFYEAKSEASKAADDFARAKKMGDMMSAKKLMEDNGELIAMDKYADRLSKMIKAKRDMQDVVKQDEKLTVAEKRLKLKALEIEEQKVYDRYLDIFKKRTKERRERLDKAA